MLRGHDGEKSALFETIITTDRMTVGHLVAGAYENNVYVVRCENTGQAVIIDAAAESDRIIAGAAGHDITAILTTHGHFDHIGAVDEVKAALKIPFRLHMLDAEIAARDVDEPINEGTITVGELTLDTLHTPGHTPGSVCFLAEGYLFTGDTLFPGGPGATRFDYSDFDQIISSIQENLMSLPDSTLFYPGHGKPSTIGSERPSLSEWIERRW